LRTDSTDLRYWCSTNHAVPFSSRKNVPGPQESSVFQLEAGGVEGVIRRAAMEGLASVRGRETETFELLSPFVSERTERVAAIRALRRLPKNTWPVDKAPQLLSEVMKYRRLGTNRRAYCTIGLGCDGVW
jgi:hypothetical protein